MPPTMPAVVRIYHRPCAPSVRYATCRPGCLHVHCASPAGGCRGIRPESCHGGTYRSGSYCTVSQFYRTRVLRRHQCGSGQQERTSTVTPRARSCAASLPRLLLSSRLSPPLFSSPPSSLLSPLSFLFSPLSFSSLFSFSFSFLSLSLGATEFWSFGREEQGWGGVP